MSFPKYPEYKSCCMEWSGDIPAHWETLALKRVALFKSGNTIGPDQITEEGEYPVYGGNGLRGYTDAYTHEGFFPLVGRQGALCGNINYSSGRFWASEHAVVVTALRPLEPKWLGELLRAMNLGQYSVSAAQPGLSVEIINNLQIPLPPLPEQSVIAAFLDCETAKIDELVAEQEKLIELLKEKRQAVISHAVTKGLDPNVPMKDSGVEWLGEVPEHWTVGAIKNFFEFLDGKRIPLSGEDRSSRSGEYPYYGASGIIDWIDEFIFDEDLVLVSEDGANLFYRSTPIAFVARGKYWVNNHAHILRPPDNALIYWAERIETIDLTPVLSGSAQPKLTSEALANIKIAIPPTYEERLDIQMFISQEAEGIDALESQAQRGIDLLKERRSSLISAAVTGKIDVRNSSPEIQEAV